MVWLALVILSVVTVKLLLKQEMVLLKNISFRLRAKFLAQDGDFVKAGTLLSDGSTAPADILAIKGPFAVQEYVVNEIQEVYRLQGVRINDKHIEVIVRQMMKKVEIQDPGDTRFLEGDTVDRIEFNDENDYIFDKKVVVESGESTKLKAGQIVSLTRSERREFYPSP